MMGLSGGCGTDGFDDMSDAFRLDTTRRDATVGTHQRRSSICPKASVSPIAKRLLPDTSPTQILDTSPPVSWYMSRPSSVGSDRMPEPVEQSAKRTSGAGFAALLGLVGAALPMELDPAVHNVAILGAGNALHMDGADRALATSMGTLCIAAFILTTGSLGDRFGRKRIMLLGLLVVMAGGVIAALATSTAMFALGRALTGIGFAASFGLAFALLATIAPEPAALARTVARWLALQTAGIVLLCLLGGYLAGISWRLAYLLSPAVAALAFLWCLKTVPEAKNATPGPFDVPGLLLVAIGLVGTLYGVSNAASAGWTSAKVLLPLLLGLGVLAVFALWEWRQPQPAFPIRSFADPQLMTGAVAGIGSNIAIAVIAIQLSL
ncbi:MAG: MFS transporter, partial [Alphaproteobacteria bacterium]|nr:MFS transporter [Alphaproteobacteria bacterium]